MKYCPTRNFATIEDHDLQLIKTWNERVKPSDTIFHLGDVAFGSVERSYPILNMLNGIKYLIPGNHDVQSLKKESFRSVWKEILPELTHFRFFNYFFVLCHYPLASWMFRERNSIHLHGHCHNTLKWDQTPGNSYRIDVGVDAHPRLGPWSFVELLNLIDQRQNQLACQNSSDSGSQRGG